MGWATTLLSYRERRLDWNWGVDWRIGGEVPNAAYPDKKCCCCYCCVLYFVMSWPIGVGSQRARETCGRRTGAFRL